MSTARRLAPAPDSAGRALLFQALSDETRLAILDLLRGGERCVCDLQDLLDAAQSRLSFHLKVLRNAGLVRDRREGRWAYYTLNPDRAADIEAYARELASPRRGAGAPVLHQLGKGTRATRRALKSRQIGAAADCCDS
ncbi:MAG TPA: metalloregulator ArsR/SmtB family transcription factor [Gemmatimonadales bacterium]|nr:metalloregulator ArsR/SmtB family transcription factor [Gemmatimonadales bacterium]